MRIPTFAIACVLVAGQAFAGQPATVNARVTVRSGGADLERAFATLVKDQVEPSWIGYAVPVFDSRRNDPRGDGWSERCRLEQTSGPNIDGAASSGPVRLEPASTVMVLFRVENREVQKIRTFSSDCQIDGGGLTLYWLEGVSPAQSVAHLKPFITDTVARSESEAALAAIAFHKDSAASAVLLDLAKNSSSTRIRQRALFWIARRADPQAASTIRDAIERDPDVGVKRQAVLALGQLPKEEGIPLLITLVRSSRDPAVRKQAMSALGQSKDPRALRFFEEILR
jgi:hypothetical protein